MTQKNKNELIVGGEVMRNRFNLLLGFTRCLFSAMSCADRVVNWAEILTISFVNDSLISFTFVITGCVYLRITFDAIFTNCYHGLAPVF